MDINSLIEFISTTLYNSLIKEGLNTKQKISLILLCFIMSFTTVFATAPTKAPVSL